MQPYQPLPPVLGEGNPQHVLQCPVGPVRLVVLSTARRATQVHPVRGAVARAAEAVGVDEGFGEEDLVAVHAPPLFGQHPHHPAEQMRGQVRHLHPGQDQEAGVVGDEPEVLPTRLGRPAEVAVARPEMPRRRTPREERHRALAGIHDELQVLTDRLRVAQVVVLLEQPVELRLFLRATHLPELERPEIAQARAQRRAVHLYRLRPHASGQRVGRGPLRRRQRDVPRPMEGKHQAAADHVPRHTIRLHPAPRRAQVL
jgi:hypothetical protein